MKFDIFNLIAALKDVERSTLATQACELCPEAEGP
jgi:hypothetical protein